MNVQLLDTVYEMFCESCDNQRCHGVYDEECEQRCKAFKIEGDDVIFIVGEKVMKLSFGNEKPLLTLLT